MPDSMIERVGRDVAAEMARQADAVRDPDTGQWNVTSSETISFDANLIARAAVAALREPTEAMIRAGDAAQWDDLTSEPVCMEAQVPWRAMIAAILAEGQPASPAPATEGGHG